MSKSFKFFCPYCQQKYEIETQYIGWEVQCQSCGNTITVPNPEQNDDYKAEFLEAVELLEFHEAITDASAVAELYDLASDCCDANELINWIEQNRPELVSKKYARAGAEFIDQGKREFQERIFRVCQKIFPPPPGDVKMTQEQIRELYDLGFTAIQYIAGKSRFQAQYIINYWKALKEYFDVLASSFYDEFYSQDFTPSDGDFFAGFEESGQALHAYRTRNGIRCHACGYEGAEKRGRCPVCRTEICEIS